MLIILRRFKHTKAVWTPEENNHNTNVQISHQTFIINGELKSSCTSHNVQKLNERQKGKRHLKFPFEFQSWKVFQVNAYEIGVPYLQQVEKTENKVDSQYITFSSHIVVYCNPVHVDKNIFMMLQHGSSQAQSLKHCESTPRWFAQLQ